MYKPRMITLALLAGTVLLCASLCIPDTSSQASWVNDDPAQATTSPLAEPFSMPEPTALVSTAIVTSTTFPVFSQEWQAIVYKIDRDRDKGSLTVDQAARLRFTALSEPESLPVEYRLTPDELANVLSTSTQTYHQDGEGVLADRMNAVFYNRNEWEAETEAQINAQMATAGAQAPAYSIPAVYTTTHFTILFDNDPNSPDYPGNVGTGYTAIAYVLDLGTRLEDAWNTYADPSGFGYLMPDPHDYWADNWGNRLPRFKVSVLARANIRICGLKVPSPGIALPGEIWISKDDLIQPLTSSTPAHE